MNKFIEKFDNLINEKHDDYTNRFCYEVLYDFVWNILVGAYLKCEIDKSKMEFSNLQRSWKELRSRIIKVTTPKELMSWDKFINSISSYRHKYAHSIPSRPDPTIEDLKNWREESIDFLSWLQKVIPEYVKKLPSFQAVLTLYNSLQNYFFEVRDIIADYRKNPPHLMERVWIFERFDFQDLQKNVDNLKDKISEIRPSHQMTSKTIFSSMAKRV